MQIKLLILIVVAFTIIAPSLQHPEPGKGGKGKGGKGKGKGGGKGFNFEEIDSLDLLDIMPMVKRTSRSEDYDSSSTEEGNEIQKKSQSIFETSKMETEYFDFKVYVVKTDSKKTPVKCKIDVWPKVRGTASDYLDEILNVFQTLSIVRNAGQTIANRRQ